MRLLHQRCINYTGTGILEFQGLDGPPPLQHYQNDQGSYLNKCRKQNRPIQKRITLGQTAVARDGVQDIGLNKPGQHMRACEASD
mmetsp:Transcript_2424/g.2719  ORF Transcript_2424/g.2719 Transcript_2424/m.2719 type:complete len:85 (-) Transcript_2424:142-396(-)